MPSNNNHLGNGKEKNPPTIIHLEDYDINPITGFLPSVPPLYRLSDTYYEPWENLIDNFHNLLSTGHLREYVKTLPILGIDKLKTSAEYRRAFLVLSMLAHGYVKGKYGSIVESIPACIAIPWVEISDYLGVSPVVNHAAVALWNWRLISSNEKLNLNNLTTLITFTNTVDESWFYLISTAVESFGGEALTTIVSAIQSAHDKNNKQLIESLKVISSIVDECTKTLLRIYEKCTPSIFYQNIRPYLSGWENDRYLPNGLKYEGVDGCDEDGNPIYRQYAGGSASQSSLIQSLDIALNIEHYPTGTKPATTNKNNNHDPSSVENPNDHNNASKKKQDLQQQTYIYRIRQNIPGNHRRFLEDLTKVAIIREYILSCVECNDDVGMNDKIDNDKIDKVVEINQLVEAYNDCLDKMKNFRSKHLQIVSVYILAQACRKTSEVKLDSKDRSSQFYKDGTVTTNGSATNGSATNGSATIKNNTNINGSLINNNNITASSATTKIIVNDASATINIPTNGSFSNGSTTATANVISTNGVTKNNIHNAIRGTGGTDLIPFLKQMRDETNSREIRKKL